MLREGSGQSFDCIPSVAKDQRRRPEEVVEVIAGKREFDWLPDNSPRLRL